jgi:hypothetical protein
MLSLDLFLALVALTFIMGYAAWQAEQGYSRQADLEYSKVRMMAEDWSQIAVKRTLAPVNTNMIDSSRLTQLKAEMDAAVTAPYAYSVLLSSGGSINPAACDGKSLVAVSRRLGYTGASINEVIVKVCL